MICKIENNRIANPQGRAMWILLIILGTGLFLFALYGIASNPVPQTPRKVKKQYDKLQLFPYFTEERYPSPETIKEQYAICPPLRPERFRRRVKMLWGIDVNDYPDNAMIDFYIHLGLGKKNQLFQGGEFELGPWDDAIPSAPPLPDSIYSLARQFLFFADTSLFEQLKKYKYTYTEKVIKMHEDYPLYKSSFLDDYDILGNIYRTTIMLPAILLRYIDENSRWLTLSNMMNMQINSWISRQVFDMRSDLLLLYIVEQCKTRKLSVANADSRMKTDVYVYWESTSFADTSLDYNGFDMHFPWHNYNVARSVAGNLSFLIRLRHSRTNSEVIQYMSGQLDRNTLPYRPAYEPNEIQESIRDSIRSNNYYGYALLREFCENPMREMPTLEKVGTSFKGKVRENSALLYLEPYPDSYDIDTIHPDETFIAYEMGYDDYYFVEAVKPVESPIAGLDGYAVILDRTETVYGYMKKSEVRELTGTDAVTPVAFPHKKKQGTISDPDGYVNIRKEMTAQSEIPGRIAGNEVFPAGADLQSVPVAMD
ncbi:MAG: hypothetical protein LBE91_10170 [Tannerella sp.]|nr:hypothetical protein [Tannerella sp.]